MLPFEELLKFSSSLHGHLCAGQVLGVRMAMVGCREIGIEEPRGSKKLLVYVEIDRCATDAIQAVTGCSLGKRTLKFLDYGKMAATFVNLETQEAVRVLAQDEARSAVAAYVNGCANEHAAQKDAYTVMPEEVLFDIQHVRIQIPAEDMPGVRGGRKICAQCGEGVNFQRIVEANGRTLCIPCARGGYLSLSEGKKPPWVPPKALHIVGSKKSGKTTLIENLIPELSARGYRVGTIKHHHSSSPLEVDRAGKDSWRHRQAGAKCVALISPTELAMFQYTDEPTPLDQVIETLGNVDLVLIEGFRSEFGLRIEIRRDAPQNAIRENDDPNILAVSAPEKSAGGTVTFSPGDIRALADLIEQRILRESRLPSPQRISSTEREGSR